VRPDFYENSKCLSVLKMCVLSFPRFSVQKEHYLLAVSEFLFQVRRRLGYLLIIVITGPV
jgi:hypothetical protein